MIEKYDVLEDIHRQKSIAITKGYVTSSLVLLLDEGAWYQVRKHRDYHTYVTGDQILGMDWLLIIDRKVVNDYVEVMVKVGAAHHVNRDDTGDPKE